MRLHRHIDAESLDHLKSLRRSLYRSNISTERRLQIVAGWAMRNADGHIVRCTPEWVGRGTPTSLAKPAYATREDAESCAMEFALNTYTWNDEPEPHVHRAYLCTHGVEHWHLTSHVNAEESKEMHVD